MTQAERSILPLLLAVAAYGLVLFRGGSLLLDGDTYWHITTGHWILQHIAVPHRDVLSFTAAGTPWVDHEWLGEVALALAYDAAGWSGLVLLSALAAALAFGLLCRALGRWLPPLPSFVLTVLAYLTVLPGLLCRPHVLALPVLVVWTAGLMAARAESRTPRLLLIPLMTLWANLHGSFLFGLVLIVPLAAEAVLGTLSGGETAATPGERRRTAMGWGGFLLGSLIAACVTPNFLRGLIHPLHMMRMPVMLRAIAEWRSPDFQQIQPMEIWLVAALYFILTRGVRLSPLRILLLLGLLHAGLQHARNQILLGLVGPLILAEPLAQFLRPRDGVVSTVVHRFAAPLRTGTGAAALVLTGLFVLHPLTRGDDRATPRTALQHVPPALAAQPVLNAYDFGGYLIFRGLRPYIDGRADMYGETFLSDYLELMHPSKDKLEAALRDRKIAWTLLKPDDGAVAVLDVLPGWRRLYADTVAVVHVRTVLPQSGSTAPAPIP